jgi:hypothetical protein
VASGRVQVTNHLCSEEGNWGWYLAVIQPCNVHWTIEAIFPITDAASAALMAIKADCLRKAGVISDQEKQRVDARVRTFSHEAVLKDAA